MILPGVPCVGNTLSPGRIMMKARLITIDLWRDELVRAIELAYARQEEAEKLGLVGKYGGPTSGPEAVEDHIIGTKSEFGNAKYYGLKEPDSVNVFHVPDVQTGHLLWHCRGRGRFRYRQKKTEMIVRDDDVRFFIRHHLFFRLTASPSLTSRLVTLHGWRWATEIQGHPEWRARHGGRSEAWFVPDEALEDRDDLIPLIPSDCIVREPLWVKTLGGVWTRSGGVHGSATDRRRTGTPASGL
jgi:hypothetical protein